VSCGLQWFRQQPMHAGVVALAVAPAALRRCQAAVDPAQRHHGGRRESGHVRLTGSEQRCSEKEGRQRRRGCRQRPTRKWRGVRWPATAVHGDGREVSTAAKKTGAWRARTHAIGSEKAATASDRPSGRGHGRSDQHCREWHGRPVGDGFIA
jgi:hypothetical protein